jgi:hypothetical protein
MKIILKTANESFPEIKKDEIKLKEFETESITKELFEIFSTLSKWNVYPPDHPVVEKFRQYILKYMKEENMLNEIPLFISKFNFKIKIHNKIKNHFSITLYYLSFLLSNKIQNVFIVLIMVFSNI